MAVCLFPPMAGIYIHIPFCKQACHYCDFHFSTNRSYEKRMVDALVLEILLQKHYLHDEVVQTIYFGGGTPSLLQPSELNRVLEAIHLNYAVTQDVEISLEANPDDLSRPTLDELRKLGVNRLSIGVQSFNDEILKSLNRAHDGQTARRCLTAASEAGFHNISADIIFAIPDQTPEQLQHDLDEILRFRPAHLSAYALTIEERTAFGQMATRGKLKAVDDQESAAALDRLIDAFTNNGYGHYEVSNFALPGFVSRHNSNYWKDVAYLGVGPSAHSYNGSVRQFNIKNNHQYMAALENGTVPATIEVLAAEDKVNEHLMTGLRTMWGVDLTFIHQKYGLDIANLHAAYIDQLIARRLATLDNGVLKLTRPGLFVADRISADLFVHSTE